jgi:hypothetical protein
VSVCRRRHGSFTALTRVRCRHSPSLDVAKGAGLAVDARRLLRLDVNKNSEGSRERVSISHPTSVTGGACVLSLFSSLSPARPCDLFPRARSGRPTRGWTRPRSHSSHSEAVSLAAKRPGLHSAHSVCPTSASVCVHEYLFVLYGHDITTAPSMSAARPTSQDAQVSLARSLEYLPTTQSTQSTWVVCERCER